MGFTRNQEAVLVWQRFNGGTVYIATGLDIGVKRMGKPKELSGEEATITSTNKGTEDKESVPTTH